MLGYTVVSCIRDRFKQPGYRGALASRPPGSYAYGSDRMSGYFVDLWPLSGVWQLQSGVQGGWGKVGEAEGEIVPYYAKWVCGCKARYICTSLVQTYGLPCTRVNKRIHLFSKLQGNMCLIPNNVLNNERKKLVTTPKLQCFFGSPCTWQ